MRDGSNMVALAIDVEPWSSEQIAAHFEKQADFGGDSVSFVIDGSCPLLRSHDQPHQLMLVITIGNYCKNAIDPRETEEHKEEQPYAQASIKQKRLPRQPFSYSTNDHR
ncbi:hypothetical protein [Paenibacillus nasutitermitis]|uniref:hypothetical protein n=1 Tax=Paenibacillus nasutitermitis TaxID=1652958 RepID=UPI00166E5202|nr:hypothetical protein [Paenibacillus nasutitermitis]